MSMHKNLRIAAITAAVAAGSVGGALLAAPAISSAQDATSAATSTEAPAVSPQQSIDPNQAPQGLDPSQAPDAGRAPQGQAPADRPDPHQGGHIGPNGTREELLTGDTATRVTEAATAAVPDGTVLRVENDAEGATYEAHVQKADGSEVTVKLDAAFAVTSIENGPA